MSGRVEFGYAGTDKGRYEPPACRRCGRRPEVQWVNVSSYDEPDRWLPGELLCRTPGCVDKNGSSRTGGKAGS